MSSAADPSAARARVTAVVVSHDGASWLPTLLAALAASTRPPDVVIGVDTGSRDDSVELLRAGLGAGSVVEEDRRTGFGAAVAAGLGRTTTAHGDSVGSESVASESRPGDEYLWLLHDDCAPASDALSLLLAAAASDPRIAVVGCRVRGWPRGRRLLEVGVTITGTGRRETGLEPGERDQGQYDAMRDVLGVSTAGMLVRRSAWEALGGLDPRLPLFRDDVDLGWRAAAAGYRVVVAPAAVVFHAEAASRGAREISSTASHPHRADRSAGLFTVLANCRTAALPIVWLRLLLGSLVRVLGYLVAKLPGAAWDEVAAATTTLGRPVRLVAARRWRRQHRPGPRAGVRQLLPPWWTPYANGLDAVLARFAESLTATRRSVASSSERLRGGWTVSRHPQVIVLGGLVVASVVASWGLLGGAGLLQGGALLPAPDTASGWWRQFVQARHPVGLGSDLPAAPYTAVLALAATVLLGKAWLVVDLLMLFAPVLAGAGAWVASGRWVSGVWSRGWMTVAYALLPVVTGAVATGHLGTVVVAVLLPWVARGVDRLLDPSAPGRWETAWATGLLLSLAVAFAPLCWIVAVALGAVAVGWLLLTRPLRWQQRAVQCLLALAIPFGLLAPWSLRLLTHPGSVRLEAGVVDVPGSALPGSAWQLAFLRVGALGQASWWVTGGITVAAVLALLRPDTRTRVGVAWLVAAVGFAAVAVFGRDVVMLPLGAGSAYPWLGVPLVIAGAGLVAAAGIAADGLRRSVGSGSFGWRQPLAAVAVVAGVSAPVLGLLWWVGPASAGALHRGVAVPVPAYMADAMSGSGARVLVLSTGASVPAVGGAGPGAGEAAVGYQVLSGDGYRLGDDSVLPASSSPRLAAAVGSVLSERGPGGVRALARLGIGYVVLPSPQDPATVGRLDSLPGLTRTSTDQRADSGWQVGGPQAASGPSAPAMAAAAPSAGSRGWLVAGLALAWVAVAVLAAPGAHRRPTPEGEPSE